MYAKSVEGLPPGTAKRSSRDTNSHLFALAFLAIIFYLPYFVPQHPVASDSYLFGYNNRAGIILLLVISAGAAIWRKGYNLDLRSAGPSENISGRTLGICLAIQLAACLVMVLIAGRFGGFCESSYEIDRVWLVAHGKIPYVGFEWPFGVLFLYGPLLLSHLLRCGIAGGYYVFWVLVSLAGVGLLFATINRLDYPSPRKTSIFLILFVAFLPTAVGMGAHYTWLRYIAPFYCILIVHGVGTRNTLPKAKGIAAALAVVFTGILLLISPEMAIAHAFACFVLLFPGRSAMSPAALPARLYLAMLALLAALFVAALKLHLLDTLLASGGGADSFPIPLSLPILLFFAVVFVCACSLVRRWAEPSLNDNSIALIILSVPLVAAALGRCDPGHILANGVGLLLAVFLYASRSPRMWRLYRDAFLIAMIAIPAYSFYRFFLPLIGNAAMRTAAESMPGEGALPSRIAQFGIRQMPYSTFKTARLAELASLRLHVVPTTIDFASLYPGVDLSDSDGILEAPFGYKPNGFGTYLSSRIDYGYFDGVENANTPEAVQRKIDELVHNPDRYLLLPDQSAKLCNADGVVERHLITVFFFFPYPVRVSHPQSVHKRLCDYIADHFTLTRSATPDDFEYELWSPKVRMTAMARSRIAGAAKVVPLGKPRVAGAE